MTHQRSKAASILASRSSLAKALLKEIVAQWQPTGLSIVGLIEESHGLSDRVCNAGILRDVVSGEAYSIYLDELHPGKICHIDASGAERACAAVLAAIDGCDLLVLSKFGKLEAAGGGLFPAFVAANESGKPVLTTVSAKHLPAWNAFMPDAAVLPTEIGALQDWWAVVRRGCSTRE